MQARRFDFAYGSAQREGYLSKFHRPNIFQATSRFFSQPGIASVHWASLWLTMIQRGESPF